MRRPSLTNLRKGRGPSGRALPIEMKGPFAKRMMLFAISAQTRLSAVPIQQSKLHLFFPREAS